MKEAYELRRDGARNLRFTGDLIAAVSSKHHEGPRNTRWTELTLYRTAAGKLVAHVAGLTLWQGESDRFDVHVCPDEAALIEALGTGWLAKSLYDAAGIECVEAID